MVAEFHSEIGDTEAGFAEADAVHEQLVVRLVCAELLREEPGLTDDVFLGAHTCLSLERQLAERFLDRWMREEVASA